MAWSIVLGACGSVERCNRGLFDPIPPFDPDVVPQQMDMTTSLDLSPPQPEPLFAPVVVVDEASVDHIKISWSTVEGATSYELEIDGVWQPMLETSFVDENAPAPSIQGGRTVASDAEHRTFVELQAEVEVQDGEERTYRVRAIRGEEVGPESAEQRASRPAQAYTIQWFYRDSDSAAAPWFPLEGADSERFEDFSASAKGEPRGYRCEVSLSPSLPTQPCKGDVGSRLAISKIVVGGVFGCALFNNQRVKCWGPIGSTLAKANEAQDKWLYNPNLTKPVQDIYAGFGHACAIFDDLTTACWGANDSGQLGRGFVSQNEEAVTTPLNLEAGVQSMALGTTHTCALLVSGRIKCWGDNQYGQLGYGDTINRLEPPPPDLFVPLSILGESAEQIVASERNTCLRTNTGKVSCWGSLGTKFMGFPREGEVSLPFSFLPAVEGSSLQMGVGHACVITADTNELFCWGDHEFGQCGVPSTRETLTTDFYPSAEARVPLAQSIEQMALGGGSSCALDSTNQVYCWGVGDNGQLGLENTQSSRAPQMDDTLKLGDSPIQQLVAGPFHSCILSESQDIRCWGASFFSIPGAIGYFDVVLLGNEPGDMPPPPVPIWDEP